MHNRLDNETEIRKQMRHWKKKTWCSSEMGLSGQFYTCIRRKVQTLHWTGIWEGEKTNTRHTHMHGQADPHAGPHTHSYTQQTQSKCAETPNRMLPFSRFTTAGYFLSGFFSPLSPCPQCPHLSLVYSGRGPISIVYISPLPIYFLSLKVSPWLCGRWGLRYALLTVQIIAIHHLFIFSFRKGGRSHYCIIISCRGYRGPEPTLVLLSLFPHTLHCELPLHSIMLMLTWLQLKVLLTMWGCSLWALVTFRLFIALQSQYHKKPYHRGWQWDQAKATHKDMLLRFSHVAMKRVASLNINCLDCLLKAQRIRKLNKNKFICTFNDL